MDDKVSRIAAQTRPCTAAWFLAERLVSVQLQGVRQRRSHAKGAFCSYFAPSRAVPSLLSSLKQAQKSDHQNAARAEIYPA
jgi:hypothetical protein